MNESDRSAYQSESILAEGVTLSNDTWETGLNCNQLVLGPSGSGKTRNFLKPNLLQANASYLVLDTKGLLYQEVGPALAELGYEVQNVNFADVEGTVGYNPLDHIRRDPNTGTPSQSDIISVASALCPVECGQDPFWDNAAAYYLVALIAYVLETHPVEAQTFDRVVELFESCVKPTDMDRLFKSLEHDRPDSFALAMYSRASCTQTADKMHASIMGIIAEKLRCLGFANATTLFRAPKRVDFSDMGKRKVALFASVSDTDYSLSPLTSLFVTQAIQGLMRTADAMPGGRLKMPVRLFLDDFSNLRVPDFDKVISVTRSREVWCTVLCQSVAQLQGAYGEAGAETVMGNCDVQLVLAFQDNATTRAYAGRAGRTTDTLLATPLDESWLFVRGRKPSKVHKYDLTKHQRYVACMGGRDNREKRSDAPEGGMR